MTVSTEFVAGSAQYPCDQSCSAYQCSGEAHIIAVPQSSGTANFQFVTPIDGLEVRRNKRHARRSHGRNLWHAAIVTASLAAASPVMADEPQQATPTPAPRPAATATHSTSGSNDPTVASPELRRELFQLTVSQIRAACPGATTEFILKQLEAQTPLDKLRDEWAAQQAATIEKLKSDRTNILSDTIVRLKEACPGAPDAFVMEKLVAGSTIEAARADWMKRMTERISMLESGQKTLASTQVAKIRELCPEASNDFIVEQLTKGSSPEQIKLAWLDRKLELLNRGVAAVGNPSVSVGTTNRQLPQVTLRSRIIKSDGEGVATVLIENQRYELRKGDEHELPQQIQGVPTRLRVEELTDTHIAIKFTPPGLREIVR